MLLITTCRKPCRNTRVFARNISYLLPGAEYVVRGKKSVYGLIEAARQKGLRRIAVISDYKGNPGEVEFIRLDKRDWQWAETIIRVKGVDFQKSKGKIGYIAVEGKLKKTVIDLFDLEESDEPDIVLIADDKQIRLGDRMNIKIEVYKNSEE